jgi:hypothetical protein
VSLPAKILAPLARKLGLMPRSAMLTSPYRGVRRLGTLAFALRMLLTVRRTKWFYSRGRVPPTRIEFRPPTPVSDADVELCQRLLAAFSKAGEQQPGAQSTEGMWSWIFDARQGDLAATLKKGDPAALAELMASMLAQDFVLGMAQGPLIRQTRFRLEARAWGLKSLDGLASLAEALGVVAVESPEQGGAGLAFEVSFAELFAAIEGELGFRVDFPDIGAPSGLAVEGRLITPDTPDQIYAAIRLDQAISLHLGRGADLDSLRIVEIGGGHGAMCHWFLQRQEAVSRYTIVDLPIVNVLQGYFLGRALGPDRVSLYGEPPAQVEIVPNFALAEVESPCDALVNKDSMPEMPYEAMVEYLEWGADNCEGLFYSHNQEAAVEFLGETQGVVHKAVAEMGGFERLRRDAAWVRGGYVEEVYVPRRSAPVVPGEPGETPPR